MPATTPMSETRRDLDCTTDPAHLELPYVTTSVRPADDAAIPASHVAPVFRLDGVSFYYGGFRAVKDITIHIPTNRITALIGPSGCGKSTLLRTINRMNDLIPGTRVEGMLRFHDEDLYASYVDPVEVRRPLARCSKSPIRSRSRSTTTSRSARG